MKILWMSDSPTAPTGFGNATLWVCAGLADRGHQVSILDWQQRPNQPTLWHSCALYPINFSADKLSHYLHKLQPDVLITQGDIWWLTRFNYPVIANAMHNAGIPWILYYPIDSDMGENRLPSSWIPILKTIDLPVAMSCYGRDITQANGVNPAYIPLGVDTNLFQPPVDKQVAKQALGYEGKFVVLSDARNTPRKLLPRTLEIFQRFAVDKDDVILHLHCDPDDPSARSAEYFYDLRSDTAFLNLTEKVFLTKDMSFCSAGLPLAQLVQLYQAADVNLLASSGEKFGLPTLQAAATGVVPLAPDYAASRELVLDHGEAISIRHFLLDPFGLRRALIDIDDAVSKLEKLYQDRQLLVSKAQKSRDFALSYDWKGIVSQWDQLLQHEIPHRRANLLSSVNASGMPSPFHVEKDSSDLTPIEQKNDQLVTELLQDIQPERTLRIPVTLPLVKSKQRIPGYVYAASQCDVPTVLALHRIFPGLKVWSTLALDFSSIVLKDGQYIQIKVIQTKSPEYRPHLAISTLALDLGSFDSVLPEEAAKLGVPCIGLAQQREQARLWPELSMEKPDPLMATELGRQMLTDQGVATDLCLAARQRLADVLIESKVSASIE